MVDYTLGTPFRAGSDLKGTDPEWTGPVTTRLMLARNNQSKIKNKNCTIN